MQVIKLTMEHKDALQPLFDNDKYMGAKVDKTTWNTSASAFSYVTYKLFVNAYLSGLNNFHAYGAIDDDGVIHAFISYYESIDEPSWYYTLARSLGDNQALKDILDKLIEINESKGRFKVYSLVNAKHARLLRKVYWSDYNSDRYHYVDEYMVPAKCRTYYSKDWELLFKRTLLPTDTIVRLSFLKQEHRTTIPVGGNI
jgi:hypothetical protein